MSKFKKSKHKPMTPPHKIEAMTIDQLRDLGNQWARFAANASREAAYVRGIVRLRKRAEAKAA